MQDNNSIKLCNGEWAMQNVKNVILERINKMREILFRGYSVSDKKWYYGYIVELGDKYYIEQNGAQKPFVEKDSVGQYTGFKDGNGNKIFEGDIIKTIDVYEINYYEVYYCKELGEWWGYDEFTGTDDELYKIIQYKNKVVSNKYEENLKEINIYGYKLGRLKRRCLYV